MTIPARPGAITHLAPRPFVPATRTPCFGKSDLFTPPEGATDLPERLRAARELCRTCPVITACEAHALGEGESDATGVRGGLSQQQRGKIKARRQSRRSPAGPRTRAAA